MKRLLTYFQAVCANYVNEYNAKVLNGLSLELLALFQEEASEAKKRRRKIKEDFLNAKLQKLPAPTTTRNSDETKVVESSYELLHEENEKQHKAQS